jgi:peptide/nickel transport system permease protein
VAEAVMNQTQPGRVRGVSPIRLAAKRFRKNKGAMVGLAIVILFILSAVFAPYLAPYDPLEGSLEQALQGHSRAHWLGTDEQGRDVLSRIIFGGRYSLAIGVVAVSIAIVLGVLLGVLSGYVGGRVDNLIMRATDILMAFPGMLLAMAIVSALGPSLVNLMISIGVYSVPTFARVVRGSVLSIKEMEYVEAARAVGLNHVYIVLAHVLPNCVGPFLVLASLQVATAILVGAGLSFLGLGPQPPTPEWGAMLSTGQQYLRVAPWVATYPGFAIMFVVLGFNILGDGVRDALDPRLKT